MSSLTGQKIKDTYQSLLKTDDNGLITTAFKNITDGSGSASGLYLKNNGVDISGSLTVNGVSVTGPFLRNQTIIGNENIIKQHESIFNPDNLRVLETTTFTTETDSTYYILGDLINSGSIIVSGTIHVDGALLNYGPITGPGIIE
jgi:hypothetical protein